MARSGEIVGIALPFAAGVGSAAIILKYTHMPLMTAGGISVICVAAIAILLAVVGRNARHRERRWREAWQGASMVQERMEATGKRRGAGASRALEQLRAPDAQKVPGWRRVAGVLGRIVRKRSDKAMSSKGQREAKREGEGARRSGGDRCARQSFIGGSGERWCLSAVFALAGVFCYFATACRGASAEEGAVMQAAGRCAERLRDIIDSIPFGHEQSAALIKALLTGERSSLSRATVLAFRASGASHLLALSGLHLGFIYLIIRRICNLIPWRGITVSYIRAAITVGLCGFYTLMTGAGASIVRAFLFICIRETAGICPERKSDPGRTLLCALTIQLALSPASIASIGFQLSYLAMAGITFILPWMQSWYPPSKDPVRKLWDTAALSISCQITTAPLAWWYFRTFPQYFLITNIIAMPLCSAVMSLSIATIALYATGICPEWLIALTDLAVQSIINALRIISEM